jgi:ribosome recycling factor
MIDEVTADLQSEMDGTIASLQHDLARVRTGRANPDLLSAIMVDYYGTETSLNKLATISAPEARLLVVHPFDQSAVGDIDKAIRNANIGFSPINDGKVVRVPIPELTEERRKDLVKQVRKEGENHRVSCRNHRRDANDLLKTLLTDKDIGEDANRKGQEDVQKITDVAIARIDEVVKAKEEEVMAV